MKKIIPLIITGILLAGNLFAQKLNAKITDSVNVTCMGDSNGSAAVEGIGGYTPYTYLWEPGGQTTDTATGLAAGTYTATVIDTASDTAEAIATIGTAAPPIVVATSSSEPSCFGMNNAMAAITSITGGTPPFQIEWLPIMNNNDTVTGLPASTYTAQVTDANGCQVQTPVPVSQPPPLQLTATGIDSLAVAYASGGTPPYTFTWSPGGYTSDTVSGLVPGTYTITVTDSNLCYTSAAITVAPGISCMFTLANATTNCGNGSTGYFEFDISAFSAVPAYFNNCVVDIDYSGGEFLGDNVSDSGVIVTQVASATPGAGNDYNILNTVNLSDSVIEITLGSDTGLSPNGVNTGIDIHGTPILHVKLRIQNSCATGTVNFTNTSYTDTTAYYSVAGTDTVCTNCALPCDSCNPYPCGWDSVCMCYTATCYHDYCCSDSVIIVGKNYSYNNPVLYGNGISDATVCPLVIGPFTNPINAGTNSHSVSPDPAKIPPNSSIFTITGSGFGSTRGTIKVTDANQDSILAITLDTNDILYWSENLIKVKMPSYIYNNNALTPGTGPFEVYNACGESATDSVQINYNIINFATAAGIKLRVDIVRCNDTESIKFRCDTSITNNTPAYLCVKKAIAEWNCYTGVNWKLVGPPIILDTSAHDSISVIYFSNNLRNFASVGTIMQTQPWYLLGCIHSSDSVIFKDESDLMIKRSKDLAYGRKWNYDTTSSILPDSVLSFYDAILHELGHAHGLNHINDTSSLMWWIARPGHTRPSITSCSKFPGPASLLGGLDMVFTSAAYSPSYCNDSILIPCPRNCIDPTLSIPDIPENGYNLNLYPNPANGSEITIAYYLKENAYIQFKIFDCIGREVLKITDEHKTAGNCREQINIANLARGVYLFTANINGTCQTIKFIKL